MKPTTRNVLDRLRVGPATTHDLCQPEVGGIRFGGRIKELRDLGYVIDRKRVREGSHLYTLVAEPSSAAPHSAADVRHGAVGELRTGTHGRHETADMPAPSDSPLVARAETSTHAGNASAWRGLITPCLPGATPGPAIRTPLTYYGGKQLLASQIVAHMPAHRVYLDAFAGGAAVLFAKPRAERETLNDLDGTVMRFWRALRERPDELAAAVAATPYGRAEWHASRDHDTDDDVEAARRLLVEIDQSFSRSRESWSTPCIGDGRGRWQPGSWANLPPKLLAAATRLRGVALEHEDALTLIPRWDRADAVIYVDPPYTGPLRTERTKGYRVDDDGSLWSRLVDVLLQVEHAAVILSGYPCGEAERLDWRMVQLERKRTAQARMGGTLLPAPETLWLSPNVPERVPTLFDMLDASAVAA